jgi:hypothetical protein
MVWEIRAAGSDTLCSGGFRGGAAVAAPSAPTVTGFASGGSVAANTYYVVITHYDGHGETTRSAETSVTTTGASSRFTVTSPSRPTGGGSWAAYAGTVSGGPYFPLTSGNAYAVDLSRTTTPATTGTGPPGTDYSQQDAAQITYTDLVIDATTNTLGTSAGNPFTQAHVGNTIAITSGTGFTVQRVEILNVSSAGVATFDKSLGTLSSTGGNGKLGGALASPGMASLLSVDGNTVHIKGGTYTCSGTQNVSGGRVNTSAAAIWHGYGTARLDYATRPILQCGASSMRIIENSANYLTFDFFEFRGNSQTSSRGFYSNNGGSAAVSRCKFSGFSNSAYLADFGAFYRVTDCEFTACSGSSPVFTLQSSGGGAEVTGCLFYANTVTTQIIHLGGSGNTLNRCVVANNTGCSAGIFATQAASLHQCVAYGNAGIGIDVSGNNVRLNACVSYGNTTWQYSNSQFATVSTAALRACAGGGGSSGVVNTQYIKVSLTEDFVTLTADPFVNGAALDFTPNASAGGGAALKNAAYPRALPGGTTPAHPAIGAVEAAASAPGAIGGGNLSGGLQ